MKKQLYIIRHGETQYNLEGRVQGQGIDSHLNQTGWKQAKLFFEFYQNIPFGLLISSFLTRSRQTLSFFDSLRIPKIQTPLINEINWGIHEGEYYTPEVKKAYHKMISEWKNENYDYALQGGESANQLANRLKRFIKLLEVRPEKNILICSHGRTIRCLLTLLHGEPLHAMEKYRHDNTGLFLFNYQNGKYHAHLENDVRHLQSEIVTSDG